MKWNHAKVLTLRVLRCEEDESGRARKGGHATGADRVEPTILGA
jgi:hypothetical protein